MPLCLESVFELYNLVFVCFVFIGVWGDWTFEQFWTLKDYRDFRSWNEFIRFLHHLIAMSMLSGARGTEFGLKVKCYHRRFQYLVPS